MRADVTRRLTADRTKHYVGVVHQQGRVWLDADWNADVFERLARLQQETFDIVGACGAPDPGTAFQLSPLAHTGSDFRLAGGPGPQGRYYVDGLVAELDQSTRYRNQTDLPDAPALAVTPPAKGETLGLAYLEVWRRLVTYLEDPALREIALGGPDTATRLKTIAQVKVLVPPADAKLSCATSAQFLPQPGQGTLTTLQPTNAQPDDLCRLPDPANYTGRENHLYRIEIHDGGDVLGSAGAGFAFSQTLGADVAANALSLTLAAALSSDQAAALLRAGVALLADANRSELVTVAGIDAARTTLTLADTVVGAYAVASGAALTGGAARFKWSRDNAAFAVQVSDLSVDRTTVTLASLGRDQATTLRQGDLVELEDDASALGPARGHLTHLSADPDPDLLTATLADPLPANFQVGRHLTLRRWDGVGWARAVFDPVTTPDLDLGDGVHIQFGGEDLRPGDFWQFAARSADGSVEPLTDAPPAGIIRHVCPLGVIHWQRRPFFGRDVLAGVFREAGFSADQVQQLAKVLEPAQRAAIDEQTAEDLAARLNPPATPDQLTGLRAGLAKVADTDAAGVEQRPVITSIDDCRVPFEPLTKLKASPCDCTVAVAPGESIPDAIGKVGPGGGTVCLLPGTHELDGTVSVSKQPGLTLRGAGAATIVHTDAPVAFHFDACDHLTLRDLTIVSGRQAQAPSEATLKTQADIPDLLKELQGAPPDGVVTCVGCRAVSVTGCTVRCLGQLAGQIGRTCITSRGAVQPEGRIAFTPDFTVRDCRLQVDARQSGMLVINGQGIVVEDIWVVNLATLNRFGFAEIGPVGDGAQLGLFGIALVGSTRASAVNNVLLGLEVAALLQGQGHGLRGNLVDACAFGIATSATGGLLLTDNAITTNLGVAVLVDSPGEVHLRGNIVEAPAAAAPAGAAPPARAAAVQVQAQTALLQDNSVHVVGKEPPSHAVDVRAVSITYGGNRSVCDVLPARTNVLLFATAAGAGEGKLTAWGNTCLEPAIPNATNVLNQLEAVEKRQNDVMAKLLGGGDMASVQQELTQAIAPDWQKLDPALRDLITGSHRVSLVAVAGAAVTGMNVLSYNLLRVGLGVDQGSLSGVF